MNFQEQIQQIFGTTDIYELKQISRDADNYRCLKADMNNSSISEKKKNTGRKNSFTEEQLAHILALQNCIFFRSFTHSCDKILLTCRS